MNFDVNSLKTRTLQSRSGNGYTNLRFIPKEWCDAIPVPSDDNSAKIVDDFILKSGKVPIYLYADEKEFQLVEEAGETRNQESYNVTLTGFVPGENTNMREFINDGVASMEGYILLDNCVDVETICVGKGSCCPATLKVNFDSGKAKTDPKGFTLTATVDQDGVCCKYEGVGAANKTYQVAVDDTTPDVSKGTATYLLPENTGPNAVTALDNAVAGSLITFIWQSTTNHSTFANGATFQLAGAFTPQVGAKLVLQATTTSTFAERYRYLPI